jgi:hypothetical protein
MTEMVYRGLAREQPAAAQPPATELTLRRLEAVARRLEQSASGDGGSARV